MRDFAVLDEQNAVRLDNGAVADKSHQISLLPTIVHYRNLEVVDLMMDIDRLQ